MIGYMLCLEGSVKVDNGKSNPGRAACLCTNKLYYINKALAKFNEALIKPYHGLIETLL